MIDFNDFDIEEEIEISKGDIIEVLPSIAYYIQKFEWSPRMYDIIGKVFKAGSMDTLGVTRDKCVWVTHHDHSWLVPIKFVTKV